jgi:hypothetical protein
MLLQRQAAFCHEETSALADDRVPTSKGLRRLHTHRRQGIVQCAELFTASSRPSPLSICRNEPF